MSRRRDSWTKTEDREGRLLLSKSRELQRREKAQEEARKRRGRRRAGQIEEGREEPGKVQRFVPVFHIISATVQIRCSSANNQATKGSSRKETGRDGAEVQNDPVHGDDQPASEWEEACRDEEGPGKDGCWKDGCWKVSALTERRCSEFIMITGGKM